MSTSHHQLADATCPDAQPVPVVVLHGIYGTGMLFDGLRAALDPARYPITAPDIQGHGTARLVTGPLDAVTVAEALVPALTADGFERFHLIGHSHGGAAAQVIARLFPDRVASLVLVSSYTWQPLSWWERLGGRIAPLAVRLAGTRLIGMTTRITRNGGGGRRLSAVAARNLARQMAANDAHQMARALAATRLFDSRPWLHEIRAPTLVITGSADHMVSPRQSVLLAAGIPGARLEVIRRAGHIPPLSHPDEFHRLVSDWLAEVDRSGRPLPAGAGETGVQGDRSPTLP
ncbi:MAG TPA: alpha/beta hydrolase [Thermomicrobiales bacterium]|nr:alpha/beta hydrolase [Thermomicrobiales bacterium]